MGEAIYLAAKVRPGKPKGTAGMTRQDWKRKPSIGPVSAGWVETRARALPQKSMRALRRRGR